MGRIVGVFIHTRAGFQKGDPASPISFMRDDREVAEATAQVGGWNVRADWVEVRLEAGDVIRVYHDGRITRERPADAYLIDGEVERAPGEWMEEFGK